MHVIEQPLPPAPEPVAEPDIVAQWTALYDAHSEIDCLMLESMTHELHRQFELYYPLDMIQDLRSMFAKQAGVEKFDLIQSFHACKQEEGKPVADYVLKMKGYVGIWNAAAKSAQLRMMPATTSSGKELDKNCPVYLAELQKKKKQVGSASSSVSVSRLVTLDLFNVLRIVDISVSRMVFSFYFMLVPRNGIYEIDMHDLVPNVNSIYNVSNKRVKHNLDSTYLWHCRLAHINKKRIKQLQQERWAVKVN
ncbi:retrotransposon protein, putative, ty1-copia subclass [Tanacetum coccineum]